MKITVLNGSPKGPVSVTMQYIKYLENRHTEHSFSYLNVAHGISSIERTPEKLREIADEVKASDLVLWAFPLYYMLCCSQCKRFIELIFQGEAESFRGIPAAALTTSIKFYDHTAQNYIREICDDLRMPFCGGYSAESSDLFKKNEREKLEQFFSMITDRAQSHSFMSPSCKRIEKPSPEYTPGPVSKPVDVQGRWLVLADLENTGKNLKEMVNRFIDATDNRAELIDISGVDFKPCTGCCRCALDNRCMFGDDAFVKLHRDRVQSADVIVLAGEMKDRYLSSTWKKFLDRSFYMGHTPSIAGRQVGFIISGQLRNNHNLRELLTTWVELQDSSLVDIVTDEHDVDRALDDLVRGLEYGRMSDYISPRTFRQVGGFKLFRDYIWGELRPIFQADHRYYRKHGLYDFPQKSIRIRLMNLILPPILRIPPVKRKMLQMMPGAMIQRFGRVVEL